MNVEYIDNLEKMNSWEYFSSPVYTTKNESFVDSILKISNEYLDVRRSEQKFDEIYPVYQTYSFHNDLRIYNFYMWIGVNARNILDSQGYDVSNFDVVISDLWCQEHHKYSGHEIHLHSGSILSGFYFLEHEPETSKVLIHDPRLAKVYVNLPEKNEAIVSHASNIINFEPNIGTLMITNSWLQHSITKNSSNKPFKFVHFNLNVIPKQHVNYAAEVI